MDFVSKYQFTLEMKQKVTFFVSLEGWGNKGERTSTKCHEKSSETLRMT